MSKQIGKTGTLDDLPEISLEGGDQNGDERAPLPKMSKALIDEMRKRAEANKGEVYPSWDPVRQGPGARIIGTLVEKRTIPITRGDKHRDAPMMVIDTGAKPACPILTKDSRQDNAGPITVWCGTVLARHYEKAEIGKLTYIEYLGSVRGQSANYNDFIFSQMEPGGA